MTSRRFLNFLERSLGFDAFIENGNNGFQPGVLLYDWVLDERAKLAASDKVARQRIEPNRHPRHMQLTQPFHVSLLRPPRSRLRCAGSQVKYRRRARLDVPDWATT